jgi:hypothetical protein
MKALVSNFGTQIISPCQIYANNFRRQVVSEGQTAGGFEWGYALPGEPTGSNDEYIGYIVKDHENVLGSDMD